MSNKASKRSDLSSLIWRGLWSRKYLLIAAIAVMPTIVSGPQNRSGERNLMFFGGFADMSEAEYVEEMLDRLADQPRFLEMVARDVYQNGQVLAHKKYRLLRWAYSIFIVGLVASVAAFALSYLR